MALAVFLVPFGIMALFNRFLPLSSPRQGAGGTDAHE